VRVSPRVETGRARHVDGRTSDAARAIEDTSGVRSSREGELATYTVRRVSQWRVAGADMGVNRWVAGGALLVVIGGVWALQGVGVLQGSVMSNDSRWLVIGLLVAAVGAAVLYRGMGRSS
jgi:hypothetical protein